MKLGLPQSLAQWSLLAMCLDTFAVAVTPVHKQHPTVRPHAAIQAVQAVQVSANGSVTSLDQAPLLALEEDGFQESSAALNDKALLRREVPANVSYQNPGPLYFQGEKQITEDAADLKAPASFTLSTWCYPIVFQPKAWLYGWQYNDSHVGFWLGPDSIVAEIAGMNAGQYLVSNTDAPLDSWTHLTLRYRAGDSVSLFLNGTFIISAAADGIPRTGPNGTIPSFIIGGLPVAGNNFQGEVMDARFYNEALSNDDIQTLASISSRAQLELQLNAKYQGYASANHTTSLIVLVPSFAALIFCVVEIILLNQISLSRKQSVATSLSSSSAALSSSTGGSGDTGASDHKETEESTANKEDSVGSPNESKLSETATEAMEERLLEIAGFISDGASSFLRREYLFLSIFMVLASAFISVTVSNASMVAFLVGGLTSCLCGLIGMRVAVFCNVRTTFQTWRYGLGPGFNVALRGGSIMGFCLVGLGIINLYLLMLFFNTFYGPNDPSVWEAICGYGLGGSSIALFARVGGGIYTKAADVGADLSGKNEYGMEEDDPRNPACIADNVGDNVGDVAGMGADLFGSLAESTCAALLIASNAPGLRHSWGAMCFPLMISSTGILAGFKTIATVRCMPVTEHKHVEKVLKSVLVLSTAFETTALIGISLYALPEQFVLIEGQPAIPRFNAIIPVLAGLWCGLIIGLTTEYYTSHSYPPVREIAESQKTSAATGIIFGLALGYMSCVVPTICLAATIVVSYSLCNMYGVSLAALGMLSTLTMGLTIDGFGPISDNAGGLAEMAGLPHEVRENTDALDAAGNTTAAIGKGFAIGSAALVSLALFGAFCQQVGSLHVELLDQWCFMGLFVGAMLPFAFSALTMRSVGLAANAMVAECFDQFPKILNGSMKPDYDKCIAISADASLKHMILPGCLVMFTPVCMGVCFGRNCTAGLLAGILPAGVMMAISMSNSGGAWDNSKKYIKSGGLGDEHKKNETHKNSVTGDTVGDPMKDTSGPSLNILVKLSAITALVVAPLIARHSNPLGGPAWYTG